MISGSCDSRCTSGKEGTCACSCAGANHGTAKKAWDIIQDGGNVTVKGHGLDLFIEADNKGQVSVLNYHGTKVQTYRSEKAFEEDIGKFIRKGRVEVNATDAYGVRQVHLPADETRSNKVPKLTDKEAQKQIRETGATVKKVDGEYVVNVPGGTEGTAYYTDDRKDAVETAKAMMKEHSARDRAETESSILLKREFATGSAKEFGEKLAREKVSARIANEEIENKYSDSKSRELALESFNDSVTFHDPAYARARAENRNVAYIAWDGRHATRTVVNPQGGSGSLGGDKSISAAAFASGLRGDPKPEFLYKWNPQKEEYEPGPISKTALDAYEKGAARKSG